MESLKELIVNSIASSERELNLVEARFVIAVIESMNMRSETSDYEVENNKLKHWHKETDGLITREYINRKLSKETRLYENGNFWYEFWFKDGILHRDNVPARIAWYENGVKEYERWYQDGKLHREDGPADTKWYNDGNKWYEAWYKNDKLERENGPAKIVWHENGNKAREEWYRDGKLHREDGPAELAWDEDGNQWHEAWYKYGRQ